MLPFLGDAASTNTIFNYTNQLWKFTPAPQTNDNWKQPQFDDSGWSNGFSVFATHLNETLNPAATSRGAAIKTQLSTNHQGRYVVTYYYRTKFNITNDPASSTLTVSNMVDDGAVFYLNGQEIHRSRMPDGLATSTNYATSSIEVGNLTDTFTIDGTSLIRGENTIAVEVHQAPPASGFNNPDAVFGLALAVISLEYEPPVIISTSGSITVESGSQATLFVNYQSVSPVTFRWYFDGNLLQNNNTNTLNFSAAGRLNEGLYYVILANEFGAVTSSVMRLSLSLPVYIPLHSSWKYNQSGIDLGTNWFAFGYNDSNWSEGQGIFSREDNATVVSLTRTVLFQTNSQGGNFITHYFRKSFQGGTETGPYTLVMSNIIDDGAVFYLNGQELWRYNMPAGPIRHNTLAVTANPDGEGGFVVTNLPIDLIRQGENLMAVQLAQNSQTSSDAVFGLALHVTNIPPTSLFITSQLQNVTVEEGNPVRLESAVSGTGANFRWYKNGTLLPFSRGSFLMLEGTQAESGSYYYLATNIFSTVTSSVASVTIIPDITGPFITAATTSNHVINLVLSEPLNMLGATNPANFMVMSWDQVHTGIVRTVVFTTATNVTLTLAERLPEGINFLVIGRNMADRFGNLVSSAQTFVRRYVTYFPFKSDWRFIAPTNGPPADWNQREFNDSLWGGARVGYPTFAPFGLSSAASDLLEATSLSRGPNRVATYFRKIFDFAGSPSGATAALSVQVDDGAVFYLNGKEFNRLRMPVGDPMHTTLATGTGGMETEGPLLIATTFLRSGQNVLAVELHQNTNIFENAWFDAELIGTLASYPFGPVVVTRDLQNTSVEERQTFILDPEIIGASSYQWYRNDVIIPHATNHAYFVEGAKIGEHDGNYYAIARNDQYSITTGVATVSIVPDIVQPMLLTAYFSNNFTEVWLKFSEPIFEESAVNISNYVVTNHIGGRASVTGAEVRGSSVVLQVAGANLGRWTIALGNLKDTAHSGNGLLAEAKVAIVGFFHLIAPFDAEWKYFTPTEEITGWKSMEFDDHEWQTGRGLFGVDTTPMFAAIQSLLPVEPITHFFRKRFFGKPVPGSVLQFRYYFDDGAIININDTELLRVRMPLGNASIGTLATGGPSAEGLIETTVQREHQLNDDENILTAELHQNTTLSTDVVFGLEVSILLQSLIQP